MDTPGWSILVDNHSHLIAEAFKALAALQTPNFFMPPNKKRKKIGKHMIHCHIHARVYI